MKIDLEQIKKQYAAMTDEALLSVDPVVLTAEAQDCLSEEIARRGLDDESEQIALDPDGPAPEWLDGGFCVATFTASPPIHSAGEAEAACQALLEAGIETYLLPYEFRGKNWVNANREYRVMVPGGRMLEALSVLDQKIFNPDIVADWRTHMETMSDEDFLAMDRDAICAGLLDRANRLRAAYEGEQLRRWPADDDE